MIRTRIGRPTTRLRLEHLEDRSVPSTFTVNTTLDDVTPANGKFSLREAISKANSTPGADTIVVPAGIYKITIPGAGESANATGDFNITDGVTIQGAGAGLSVIDGHQLDRVFDVLGSGPSSIKAVFAGLTIRNGKVTGPGGGIRVGNADLVVRDCAVTGNRASATGGGISNGSIPGTGNVTLVRTTIGRNVTGAGGGGICVTGSSTLAVRGSTVRRNIAAFDGGGIAADTATLTDCTVSGNSAATFGGGVNASTMATLTNCTISGNSATLDGGGISAATGATLTNCTISGNSAGRFGGGILAHTATLTNSTVNGNSAGDTGGGIYASTAATLTNSTVSGNSAAVAGGGIHATTVATLTKSTVSGNSAAVAGGGIAADTATLTNCTVSGNSATSSTSEGGGILAFAATLTNCTVVENSAQIGGGLFNSGGTFSVRNTIVALNLTGFSGSAPDVSGGLTSLGHNLIGNSSGGSGFADGVNGDQVGTSADPLDPKLGALASNGGPTKTHALQAGSPAIDHGDNANLPPADQRGAGFGARRTATSTASRSWTSARLRNRLPNLTLFLGLLS